MSFTTTMGWKGVPRTTWGFIEQGGSLYAVLPFGDIERSFSSEDRAAYRVLLEQATVEVLKTSGTDEDAYLAAGRRMVDLSDFLVAVWDGKPAKGKDGMADVVDYASTVRLPLLHLNPIAFTVRLLRESTNSLSKLFYRHVAENAPGY